jgi:hypothetical protein
MATDGELSLKKKSTRQTILDHLEKHPEYEVPVSIFTEEAFGCRKPSSISNATKKLSKDGIIQLERRPLRRGQYTVIWLSKTRNPIRYRHENEFLEKKTTLGEKV